MCGENEMDTNKEVFELSFIADKQDTATSQSRIVIGVEAPSELHYHMEGLRWLRNETSISDAEESNNLGSRYAHGLGVDLDTQRAVEQGDAPAQSNLGVMSMQDFRGEQDDTLAVSWLRKAAELEDIPTQYHLGLMSSERREGKLDEAVAIGRKNVVMIGGHDETFMHYQGLGFNFTVLQLPDSVGKNLRSLTDKIYLIKDFSVNEVLNTLDKITKTQSIDLIFSFTEDGLLPAGYASKYYQVPGMDLENCKICIDKLMMRSHLKKSEFVISSKKCTDLDTIKEFFNKCPSGIVLKDPTGSGSKNVFAINDFQMLSKTLKEFKKENFVILAEEYLGGDEFSVETLTINSKHQVIAVTNKKLYKNSLTEELQIISPDNVDNSTFKKISHYCKRLLNTINYQHGPCHIEIKISNGKCHLIEINNRVGGSFIGLLVELTTGVNLFRETLKYYSSETEIEKADSKLQRYNFAASFIFFEYKDPGFIRDTLDKVDIIRLIMGDSTTELDKPPTNDDKVGLIVIASNHRKDFYDSLEKLQQISSTKI